MVDLETMTQEEKDSLLGELLEKKVSATGKTHIRCSCGFECDMASDVMDDQEIVDELVRMEKDPSAYASVLALMLSESDKKALYECCRGENGRVKASRVLQALMEIFRQLDNGKKS